MTKIVKRLGKSYTFDIYDTDDLISEAYMITLDIIDKYDGTHPIENFLTVSISNRLKNLRRDNSYLPEPKNKDSEEWVKWNKRFGTKKALLSSISLHNVNEEKELQLLFSANMSENMDLNIIKDIINIHLPVKFRVDYIKLKDGIKISKNKQDELIEVIREIVHNEYGKSEI